MKKIFIAFFVLLFCSAFSFGQNYWTQKQSAGGDTRCSALGLATSTKGYVISGYHGGIGHYNDTWEYDPATNQWQQKASFPGSVRRWMMGFVFNNKLYAGTGAFLIGPGDYIYYSDFYEYNPSTNIWTAKASFPGTQRAAAFCMTIDGKGYVGGGAYQSAALADLWAYDPYTNTWTQKNNMGCGARWACTTFSIFKKGYVATGTNGTFYLNDMWEYDSELDTWTQKTNFPGNARWYTSGFSINNYGYIGAGANGETYYKDFWQYSPATDTWTQIADLTGSARASAISFAIGGKGYVGTGLTSASTYTSDFWEYTPDLSGISDNNTNNAGLVIYPNPATEVLIINFDKELSGNNKLVIYDIIGNKVSEMKLDNKQLTFYINCTNLKSGKYYIQFTINDNVLVKTFVKM